MLVVISAMVSAGSMARDLLRWDWRNDNPARVAAQSSSPTPTPPAPSPAAGKREQNLLRARALGSHHFNCERTTFCKISISTAIVFALTSLP